MQAVFLYSQNGISIDCEGWDEMSFKCQSTSNLKTSPALLEDLESLSYEQPYLLKAY